MGPRQPGVCVGTRGPCPLPAWCYVLKKLAQVGSGTAGVGNPNNKMRVCEVRGADAAGATPEATHQQHEPALCSLRAKKAPEGGVHFSPDDVSERFPACFTGKTRFVPYEGEVLEFQGAATAEMHVAEM